jgi:hypothetical protein
MTTFQDKFDRDDIDLDTDGGWTVGDPTDTGGGIIEILDQYATNSLTASAGVAMQGLTVPTVGPEQSVSAWVTSVVEDAEAKIDIGVGGHLPDDWVNRVLGVWARLSWLPNGERRVSLHHLFRGGTEKQVREEVLVLSGGVEAAGFEGVLLDSGATREFQRLRLIVVEEDSGLVASVYVNNDDDDHPIFKERIESDWIDPVLAAPTDYGDLWFGFGAVTGATNLVVNEFTGGDYAQTDRVVVPVRADLVTLAEIRERTKLRITLGGNVSNVLDEQLDRYVNDSFTEILTQLGDSAYFMRKTETLSAEIVNGRATLPTYMERPLGIYADIYRRQTNWRFLHLDANGACVVELGFGSNIVQTSPYEIDYYPHYVDMVEDDDVCPIPRKHIECVVVGAALRNAEIDRNAAGLKSHIGRYMALLKLLRRDQNRLLDQERVLMGPSARRRGYSRYNAVW